MSDADSPVHSRSGPEVRWSRANFAEAIQGVQTPLSWTFWDHVMEICIRRSFGNIGALPVSEVRPPSNPDAKVASVFFGLPAGNVDVFHRIGEAMPGTSGAAVVEHLFGERRNASSAAGRGWLRYPIVAGKLPVAAVRSARSMPRLNTELRQWWRHSVIDSPPHDIESATMLLRSSAEAFIRVGVQHATVSMIGQSIAEQIEALAVAAWGSAADASTLMTGYGAMEETELMGDVWALAHDTLDIDEFLARHGYHGPDEGNLVSTVWREDAGPVKRLAERYRTAEIAHPRAKEGAQLERRVAAEQQLLSSLPRPARAKARVILRLGRALIPLRESGKASFLRATDGARCSARVLGAHLAAKGFLSKPDDVFFLTYAELLAGVEQPMQAAVQARREDHARFERLDVPQAWTGQPERNRAQALNS